ncbi:MAG: hypothetical protein EZS28_024074, partial [Streblomastix strix]
MRKQNRHLKQGDLLVAKIKGNKGEEIFYEIIRQRELNHRPLQTHCNQGEVQRESGTIHGRLADLIIGKETTGMRYALDNLIHEGAGMEDVISQIQDNTNERLSIPWLEVEDLYDGSMHSSGLGTVIEIEIEKMVSTITGRVELSEIADNGCISSHGIDQSSKNSSVEEIKVEQQVDVGKMNVGRFEMVGPDDQGQQSKYVRFENAYIQSNDGCGDNRMGSGIGENEGGG